MKSIEIRDVQTFLVQPDKLPLVVLIDHGTASASEIVAGAVMDHDRGLIVGEDSWGKGLVQTVFPLASNAAAALTVAKYLTPSGRSIQRDFTEIDDYILSKKAPDETREVRYTAKGRKVLGQGGITPDYESVFLLKPVTARLRFVGAFYYYSRDLIQHQTRLGSQMIFPQDPTMPVEGKIRIGDSFPVNDAVIEDFKDHLKRTKVEYDADDFKAAEKEIRMELEREIYGAIWGVEAGMKVFRKSDPVVLKALEVMPDAVKFLDAGPAHH